MEVKADRSKEGQPSSIDWKEIHSRLEAVREKLEQERYLSETEKEQIIRERTRKLGKASPDEPSSSTEYLKVTEFVLSDEKYGIELDAISEVISLKDLTPLPCTPPFITGVMNIRGKIVTVIDIRKMLELPAGGLTDLNRLIIVHAHGMEAGILADLISGVRLIRTGGIQPALPTLTGIRAEYIKGVTGDQLIILNVENIFSDERIIVNEII